MRRDLRTHLAGFAGMRLLITHDPVDAAVLADRVVVLDGGRIVQAGTPAEITSRPRTTRVAELTGTNLFLGTAGAEGVVSVDGGGVLVAAEEQHRGAVFAVVHPRAVALHRDRPEGAARNAWRAGWAASSRSAIASGSSSTPSRPSPPRSPGAAPGRWAWPLAQTSRSP